jgi:hypothetical protein
VELRWAFLPLAYRLGSTWPRSASYHCGWKQRGTWDPKEEYWGEEGEVLDDRAKAIIAWGPRQSFEMEQVLPMDDPDDPDGDPIIRSNDLERAGDYEAACQVLMELCESDLRCLVPLAFLGVAGSREPPFSVTQLTSPANCRSSNTR